MDAPRRVGANFRQGGVPALIASVADKADGPPATRMWTVRLTNTGLGAASGAQITGAVVTQTAGDEAAQVLGQRDIEIAGTLGALR